MAEAVVTTRATMASTDRSAARARAVLFTVAWLLPCLAIQLWFFSAQFTGLVMVDAMDAAQVARHISEGDGFTTSFIRPLSLGIAPHAASHPDLYNPPLHPLVLAVAFNVLGANDRTVGMVSVLFAVLTSVMAYLLGTRLLDKYAGALAAVLATLTIGLLKAGVAGLNVSLLAFLLAALFCAIVAHRRTVRWSAFCGAIAALAYLTDYSVLLVAVPACVLLALSQSADRRRHVAFFVLGFVVINLPWALRNWAVTGNPVGGMKLYSVAMWGTTHPVTSLYRSQSASGAGPVVFAAGHPREVLKKTLLSMGEFESMFGTVFGVILLPLFAIALFADLGSTQANRLKWALLVGLALAGVSAAAGRPRFDFMYGALGVVAAIGATAALVVIRNRALGRNARTGAVISLLAISAYPISLNALPGSKPTKPDRRNFDYLERALPSDAVILTDQPWAVAWYADRKAVWMPLAVTPQPDRNTNMTIFEAADATRSRGMLALEKAGVKPSAIYLSSELQRYPAAEQVGRWQLLHNILSQQVQIAAQASAQQQALPQMWAPPGWTLAATLPPNDLLLVRAGEAVGEIAAAGDGSERAPAGSALVPSPLH
ncbi:MAG: ArnT family glycosyltransferase [Armatimonadota bacterium]